MDTERLSPLSYGDIPTPSRFEKVCKYAPLLGWAVGAYLASFRIAPCERRIADQLCERPPIPPSVWGDEQRAGIAERVGRICAECCPWPNDYFLPDDPMNCVLCWDTGDLCEVEAIMDIEDAFGLRFSEPDVQQIVGMTLSEFVDFILLRKAQSGG